MKKLFSILLAVMLCAGLLPSAAAETAAPSQLPAAEVAETAQRDTPAGPTVYYAGASGAEKAEEAGVPCFRPYVFEIGSDNRVQASVQVEPGPARSTAPAKPVRPNEETNGTFVYTDEELEELKPSNVRIKTLTFNQTTVTLNVYWDSKPGAPYEYHELIGFMELEGGKQYKLDSPYTIMEEGSGAPPKNTYIVVNETTNLYRYQLHIVQEDEKQFDEEMMYALGVREGDTLSVFLSSQLKNGQFTKNTVANHTIRFSSDPETPVALTDNNTVITLNPEKPEYTSKQIRPGVTVVFDSKTLKEEQDYTLQYGNNTDAGEGAGLVTVTGKGSYTGSVEKAFDILPAGLNNGTVITLNGTSFTHTGAEIRPEVVSVVTADGLKLTENDYEVLYKNNVDVGTGIVFVRGKGNFDGTAETTFEITEGEAVPVALTDNNTVIKLSKTKYTYNGKARKPGVTVLVDGTKLKKNQDYTIEYVNNINAGKKAAVKVTGKGRYTGAVEAKFTITKGKNQVLTYVGKKTLSAKKLKTKNLTFKLNARLLDNTAKRSYKLKTVPKKVKKYITVSSKGKVTVKKGIPKGSYTIKVTVTMKATKNCLKTVVTKKVKISVK